MNNPTTVTIDLPPRVLDLLETYVRARTAVLAATSRGIEGRLIQRAAEQREQQAADLVLFQMMLEMRELGIGTLGEALDSWANQARPCKTFEQTRLGELEALGEAIDALSSAPDLDSLWEQKYAIRDRLLNAWDAQIGDEEHSDWLEKLDAATRRREREL